MCPATVSPAVPAFKGCDRSGLSSMPQTAFASPKSNSFTLPSGVTLTLAGFKSRWTMPFP